MAYIGKSPTGTGVRSRFYFTATGGETSLSGTDDNNATLVFADGAYVDVYLNGVLLVAGTDYNTSTANTIAGLTALAANDIVEILVYDIFTVADTVSASAGGTFNGGVNVSGDLTVDTSTLKVDSTNNRVGVGEASPDTTLHINSGATNTVMRVESTDGTADISFLDGNTTTGDNSIRIGCATDDLRFTTNSTERMRISSNNVLVGKTSDAYGTAGIRIDGRGFTQNTRDGNITAYYNRLTSNGTIVEFAKDSTTVGSIGVTATDRLYIGSGSGLDGIGIDGHLFPTTNSGTLNDNNMDLGLVNARWDDIYATNGTIQTSDQNEKQQIASLTSAEMTAAKAISALFKTFKWNDAVAAKGDAARTHTGVMAQQVATALTDAGLNAGDYAFYMSNTWWEADEAYTDDDGNAQTRTVTYDTQADAPAGATQRTRLGIRYPELLAFVGAATEQRLADIETRLTALENA